MNKNISFIGSGNVATFLAKAFYMANCNIKQIFSPNLVYAETLAKNVNAEVCSAIENFNTNVDFIIVAITDSKIEEIAKALHLGNAILLHCAGSQPIDILNHNYISYGVLYPLQTFSKNASPINEDFPFFIEGNNPITVNEIKKLAQLISNNIHEVNAEQRQTLHLAAVYTNNFINHILGISKTILEKRHLNFEYLQPLLLETIKKAQLDNPFHIQTGPAKRNDEVTIQLHRELLKNYNPNFVDIYQAITKSIQENK